MLEEIFQERLQAALQLTLDLVQTFQESHLSLRIPNVRSNSLGGQIYCIVGARESYLRGAQSGGWQGFSCSLQPGFSVTTALSMLEKSQNSVLSYAPQLKSLSRVSQELLFSLLEHERQHHGQLIRYVYSNNLSFPASWTEAYTVS